MKKSLSLLTALVLSLTLLAGCGGGSSTPPELAYMEKAVAVQSWAGATGASNMNIKLDMPMIMPLQVDYSVALESKTNMKPLRAEILITTISNNSLPGLSPFHMYVDEAMNVYLEKTAITEFFTLLNQPLPEVVAAAPDAEYLRIAGGGSNDFTDIEAVSPGLADFYRQMEEDPYGFSLDFVNRILAANPEFSLGLTQKGNTFTLKWDQSNIFALVDKIILSSIDHAKALIDVFPFDDADKLAFAPMIEDTAALKKSYTDQRDLVKEDIQNTLNQGTFTLESVSTLNDADNNSHTTFTMDYSALGLGKVDLALDSTSTKAEGVSITIPTSFAEIDPAQIGAPPADFAPAL
jgi:hypothetical protein